MSDRFRAFKGPQAQTLLGTPGLLEFFLQQGLQRQQRGEAGSPHQTLENLRFAGLLKDLHQFRERSET